jgi:hypothetical protein
MQNSYTNGCRSTVAMNLKHGNLEQTTYKIQRGLFSRVRKDNGNRIWDTVFDKFCFHVMDNLRDSIDRDVNENTYIIVHGFLREQINETK